MNVAAKPKIKSKDYARFRVFEEAFEAITKLKILQPFLSPQDEETLSILIDKEIISHLEKSLKEAERGRVEPLKNILK